MESTLLTCVVNIYVKINIYLNKYCIITARTFVL